MGLTFVTRKYACNKCGHAGKAFTVISKISDIVSYFADDSRPESLEESKLYREVIERDADDLPAKRFVEMYPCDQCMSTDITATHVDNYSDVLNFYPKSESSKWFEGFAKDM